MRTRMGHPLRTSQRSRSPGTLETREGAPVAHQPPTLTQEACRRRAPLCPPGSSAPSLPPELVSSKDVCLLVLAPVKGSIHSLNVGGQPQAGQWLRVPWLQGAGRINPVFVPWDGSRVPGTGAEMPPASLPLPASACQGPLWPFAAGTQFLLTSGFTGQTRAPVDGFTVGYRRGLAKEVSGGQSSPHATHQPCTLSATPATKRHPFLLCTKVPWGPVMTGTKEPGAGWSTCTHSFD